MFVHCIYSSSWLYPMNRKKLFVSCDGRCIRIQDFSKIFWSLYKISDHISSEWHSFRLRRFHILIREIQKRKCKLTWEFFRGMRLLPPPPSSSSPLLTPSLGRGGVKLNFSVFSSDNREIFIDKYLKNPYLDGTWNGWWVGSLVINRSGVNEPQR